MRIYKFCFIVLLFQYASESIGQNIIAVDNKTITINDIKVGADRTSEYLPLLKGKRVAVVANQSSNIKNTHLVDSLISLGISIKKVFCPEHGFRGTVDAGERVKSETDAKT